MKGRKQPSSTSIMFQSYLSPHSDNSTDKKVEAIRQLLEKHQLWNGRSEGAILNNIHFVDKILKALDKLNTYHLAGNYFTQENVDIVMSKPEEWHSLKNQIDEELDLNSSSSSEESDSEDELTSSSNRSAKSSSSSSDEEEDELAPSSNSSAKSSSSSSDEEEEELTSSSNSSAKSSSSSSDEEEEELTSSSNSSAKSSSSSSDEEDEKEERFAGMILR